MEKLYATVEVKFKFLWKLKKMTAKFLFRLNSKRATEYTTSFFEDVKRRPDKYMKTKVSI